MIVVFLIQRNTDKYRGVQQFSHFKTPILKCYELYLSQIPQEIMLFIILYLREHNNFL